MSENLAKTIRVEKKRLGLTLEQMAEKAGVSINAVSKWTKSGHVSRENLPALAEMLGLSLDRLMSESEADSTPSDEESRLERLDARESRMLALFRACAPLQQDLLLTHGDMLSTKAPAHKSFQRGN